MQIDECRVQSEETRHSFFTLHFALLTLHLLPPFANLAHRALSFVDNPPPQAHVRGANHGEGFGVVG